MSAPTTFAEAWSNYVTAWNAANAFYLLNFPGNDGPLTEFEAGFDKYAGASFRAAETALLTPARTADDMHRKQIIIDQHEVGEWTELGSVLLAITNDALRLAGGDPDISGTWDRLRAAYDAAREAADAALGDDCAANSAEFHAWEAVMRADAPDLAAVLWKLVELFGDAGRERIEGAPAGDWLFSFTGSILADVERLNGGAS